MPGIPEENMETWETNKEVLLQILNEMYTDELISDYQKFVIIVCILKQTHATHFEH